MSGSRNQIDTINQFFEFLGQGRIDEWASLLYTDVVVATPFAPKGSETNFAGIDAVRARFGDARLNMSALEFLDVDIQPLEADGRYVVVCRSEGAFAAGVTYQNNYCWLFRFKGDLIAEWTEYFDPQEVIAVQTALARISDA
jgi:ketosteroid isomerase-like protein